MAKLNPFNIVELTPINSNTFDLSFDSKLTLDMGKLYPVFVQDTLPGDKFHITPEMLIRFHPLVFPVMHRIDATIHFFYVPNRIMWKNWKKFIAGEAYTPLYFEPQGMSETFEIKDGSLWDYLGLPSTPSMLQPVLAFPFLAYARIYNEYYQDQNNDTTYKPLRDKLEQWYESNGRISPTDLVGSNHYGDAIICKRAWEHDYFTSALPYAQLSNPVNIPLTLGDIDVYATAVKEVGSNNPFTGDVGADGGFLTDVTDNTNTLRIEGIADGASAQLQGTINQLRSAMALQKFLETLARTGTRYNELIKATFQKDVGDHRVQRPEYLGGIKNNIVISEVLQTSQSNDTSALGEYAGHATGIVSGNTISYECPEHGWIMGILSVMPKTAYFQGIPKKHTKLNYLEYYWKHFAHIGEQTILNRELYYQSNLNDNNDTFGYIPRYTEYKYNSSEVHGDMRNTLDAFHLARKFASRPNLNEEFIYMEDDKRIFAVQDPDLNSLYAHIFFNVEARRPIPFFTNPQGL